ncbi:SAM-dependent methyltransferase [Variovorax sp. HJSM1_2]|uniref:SAM-dependent methyltransferase n=1 Tax=Variovorax sp. HJSM1_2 TaxID=3366263 RepID=UPI003BD8A72E
MSAATAAESLQVLAARSAASPLADGAAQDSTSAATPDSPAYFDAMFAVSDDPWQFKSRWYERRKRALTLACLPAQRYASAYEPACANGELSAALAPRCDRLLVSDGVDRAVDLARARLSTHSNVKVVKAWLPDQWPEGSFDLIVLSEFLFYLTPATLHKLARCVLSSLRPQGVVLACHWVHPIKACVLTGNTAHDQLDDLLALPNVCQLREPDLRLDVWTQAPTAAALDGLS